MADNRIKTVHARQLLDSSARPMVEVDVLTHSGKLGRGAAPTGKSVGAHEAYVLRDGDKAEYNGMSVHKAVAHVNEVIAPALVDQPVDHLARLDQIMIDLDGTAEKSKLGGNAIYSTSIALLRAAAAAADMPTWRYLAQGPVKTVPVPSFNMINGGRNGAVVQAFNEFLVMPYKADDIFEACEIAVLVYNKLPEVIRDRFGYEPAVGRSYGWVAPSEDPRVCLDLLLEAIDRSGAAGKCGLALDCASSEMYDAATGTYYLNGARVSTAELIGFARELTDTYPLVFIEDLLDEDAWEGYRQARQVISKTLILADDFTVTNQARIERAVNDNSIDGFILKPNQVGTISEALAAYAYARQQNLIATPSGRSGGVVDDVVMDLAVGLQVPFIKNGCPRSAERIEKLNFLMRIAEADPQVTLADVNPYVRF